MNNTFTLTCPIDQKIPTFSPTRCKVQVKRMVNAKFGVTLMPNVDYHATTREDFRYEVIVNGVVSVIVDSKNIIVVPDKID